MDSAIDLTRILLLKHSLSMVNRQIRLRLAKRDWDNDLFPYWVTGTESICGGVAYHVACLVTTPTLPLKSFMALPAEIQFVTDRGELRSVCGLVTEARAGDFDGGMALYHLVVRDALAVMEKRTNSRIFRGQNELEIVQVLFDEWRHSNSVLAGAFEYEFAPSFDTRRFPPREQTMQYNETDAAFVRRLLKRRGISWYIKPGRCRTAPVDDAGERMPAHTLVLFNDAANHLRQNMAGVVRYHRDDATDGRDVITHWTGARRLQPGVTTRHSWDYKHPSVDQFMSATTRGQADQGGFGNELAASLDDYLVEIPHAGNDLDDHQRLGQLRMSRHGLDTKCFYGEGCVRDFCAGEFFVLDGHPEIDSHPPAEREFVVTELETEAWNNLPADLAAHAERLHVGRRGQDPGPAKSRAAGGVDRTAPVRVRFTAVRRGVPIVPDFDPRVDLPHPQLQSAIVVGPPGEDVHCDALGRVRIRFPGMREADHQHAHGAGASGGPADSAWVRVASSWAGNGSGARQQSGTQGLPRVGTEVLVSFLGGDPDRPIVTGQLFNQVAMPPAFSGVGELPGNRYLSGTRTREINGQRGNQLRFDDTRGQISAQLASDHGTSELNLGWLTDPRVNGVGDPRGEGAELRSDLSVAVRGARGVLITAESAHGNRDPQLAREELLGLADMLQGVVDEVGKLAEHHAGDESSGRLADLADKIRHWHDESNVAPGGQGGAPIVAVAAPAGIVLASPEDVAVGSAKKVEVASAVDAEISAGRNIFVRAARGLSMFAHTFGLKLVAGRGNVTMQAHGGNIEIKASGRISLIAAEGIDLQAPDIKVVARGAQTDWGKDDIIQQCAGKHIDKAAQFVRQGVGGGAPASLSLPSTKVRTDERVVLRHEQTGEPIPNLRYRAHLADGRTFEGVTDDVGRTSLAVSDAIGDVHFDFLPEEPLQ